MKAENDRLRAEVDRLSDDYTACEQCDGPTETVQFCSKCWNALARRAEALELQNERLLHEVCGTKAFLKRLAEAKVPDFSEVAATLLEYMHTGASEKQKGEGPKPYTGYKDEGVDLS
jgi:hypothetical protein